MSSSRSTRRPSPQERTEFVRHVATAASASALEDFIQDHPGVQTIIDVTIPEVGVTPLMVTSQRDDNDETIRVAQVLMRHGARIDTRDTSGPGVTALVMAAQENKPKLLQFLVEQGAQIDLTPLDSTTQPISFAVQHNNPECVAVLAQAAKEQDKFEHVLESKSKSGRTPSYIAVERCHPQVAGVLAKVGADLRFACPVYFSIGDNLVDPGPHDARHFALHTTVRSFVSYCCAQCGDDTPDKLLKCSKCRMALYCANGKCQKKNWASHKLCCKALRKGQDMFGDVNDGLAKPRSEPVGFKNNFGVIDRKCDDDDYNRDTHPVWEYNAGSRGDPNWCRYPPRIEEKIESLMELGSPRYMYRPGNARADGQYEEPLSLRPPRGVATRYVYFSDMIEREIYTGAGRSVRRNGKRKSPNPTNPFM